MHIYLQHKINLFLIDQQNFFKEKKFTLKFKSISHPSWKIWPQVTMAYPVIQKNASPSLSQTIWNAKQVNISYSLWHPFSIFIELNGEQLFCPQENAKNCFQIHGSTWHILVPIWQSYKRNLIHFNCAETFYTNMSEHEWHIKSLRLKNIQGDLSWNAHLGKKDSLAFSTLNIEQIFINFTTFPLQELKNIQIQSVLINERKATTTPSNLYKLLIQKANFSWKKLSLQSSGRIYFPFPQMAATGEILFHANGIDQTIHQQLASLHCCAKLKEELSQTTLPSQISFTLLIRENIFYLGAIPIQTIWYDRFKKLIDTYTK